MALSDGDENEKKGEDGRNVSPPIPTTQSSPAAAAAADGSHQMVVPPPARAGTMTSSSTSTSGLNAQQTLGDGTTTNDESVPPPPSRSSTTNDDTSLSEPSFPTRNATTNTTNDVVLNQSHSTNLATITNRDTTLFNPTIAVAQARYPTNDSLLSNLHQAINVMNSTASASQNYNNAAALPPSLLPAQSQPQTTAQLPPPPQVDQTNALLDQIENALQSLAPLSQQQAQHQQQQQLQATSNNLMPPPPTLLPSQSLSIDASQINNSRPPPPPHNNLITQLLLTRLVQALQVSPPAAASGSGAAATTTLPHQSQVSPLLHAPNLFGNPTGAQPSSNLPAAAAANQGANLATMNLLQQLQLQQQSQQQIQQNFDASQQTQNPYLQNMLLQNIIQNASSTINNSNSINSASPQTQHQAHLPPQGDQAHFQSNLVAAAQQYVASLGSASNQAAALPGVLPNSNVNTAVATNNNSSSSGTTDLGVASSSTPSVTATAAATASTASSSPWSSSATSSSATQQPFPYDVGAMATRQVMLPNQQAASITSEGNNAAYANPSAAFASSADSGERRPGAGLEYPPETTPTELASMGYLSVPKRSKEDRWMVRYNHLVLFKQSCGHTRVPHGYPENPKLAWWVMNQRAQYRLLRQGKKSWLTEDRVRLLDDIEFEWNPTLESGNAKKKSG